MRIADISIRQPVFITMLMLALIVVGFIGYTRLPVDLLPDISIPTVAVVTVYPGASPAEVQREITEPLEEALGLLNGVKNVRSTSSENVSTLIVEFNMEYSAVRAAEDVRERVAAVRGTFPRDARDPVIQRFDPAVLPILSFAVADQSGRLSPAELRRLVVDRIKPRLDRIDGVADVNVVGGLEREIQVDLNLDAMRARRVAPQQVVGAVKADNLSLPGGRLTENGQELLLRTPGDFQKVGDLNGVIVSNVRGIPVYLSDVATVKDGFAEVNSYSRLNGHDSIVVSIRKQSGTNTVRVADEVKAELFQIRRDFPNLSLVLASDQSDFIHKSTENAITDLILGGIFASLVVLFFFRDLRNTLVTVAGLPVIMIGTFAILNAMGLTLNMITLLALSLAVGLVIDDAIVVRENIFRHMERGEMPKEAASRGTNEVALAVLAMTLTVVSVFLPVAFTTGLIGKFFREFGLTVATAVLVSLFEAFTLAPMLSAYFFKQRAPKPGHESEEGMAASLGRLDRGYRRVLAWALSHKKITALIGMVVFLLIVGLSLFVQMAFLPDIDSGSFQAFLQLPPGTPLAQTDAQARQIEAILKAQPGVQDVFTTVGGEGTPEQASFTVRMQQTGLLKHAEPAIRQSLAGVPELKLTFGGMFGSGSQGGRAVLGSPIELDLRTTGSLDDLEKASRDVLAALSDVPGLADLDRDYRPGKPELHVDVDRERAGSFGLSTAAIGSTIRTLVNGEAASRFRDPGREADIVVRLRESDRARLDDILALSIPSPTGQMVPLRNVATLTNSTGPAAISRFNRQPQIVVGGNYHGRSQAAVLGDVRQRLAGVSLPPGVTVQFGGQTELLTESFSSLLFSLLLAVVFVYMVLASQFGSFVQPVVIMLALPLSIIGAFLALLIVRFPFDMTAMIGIILLMGLVTKNSILLVDFTNRLRQRGLSREEALLTAGPIRLRPILMTTLSLILGMTPVALGLGAGGGFRAPMAVAVIGGLITSTLLTLLLVPVAYSIVDILLGRLKRAPTQAVKPVSAVPAQLPEG
jgi:HAE1 family hydrophobic/amphiphilic exporter-1